MKAMILAAGFGTRLRPLTDLKPKALMPVANKPILARNIEYLISHGITEIIVNAHHHSQQIVDYLKDDASFGLNIEVKVEQAILGTGGGIKSTADFWDKEPFFVINSDILTDIDLAAVHQVHQTSGFSCDPGASQLIAVGEILGIAVMLVVLNRSRPEKAAASARNNILIIVLLLLFPILLAAMRGRLSLLVVSSRYSGSSSFPALGRSLSGAVISRPGSTRPSVVLTICSDSNSVPA